MDWLIIIALNLAISALVVVLTPKAKTPKTQVQEIQGPTAEDGKEATVIFGSVLIKAPNTLWTGDKSNRSFQIDA